MTVNQKYNQFIYTHIPKCGGTSFRELIYESAKRNKLDDENIYIPGFGGRGNDENLPQLSEDALKDLPRDNYKVLANHSIHNSVLYYGIKMLKPFYYTILREPVSRFVSHYNFFYYNLGYNDCKNVHINDLAEDKLEKLLADLANVETYYLAGYNELGVMEHYSVDEKLELAKFNLKFEYAIFGILEQIDVSLNLLSKYSPDWLEFENVFPEKNKNKIKPKSEINESIYNKIAAANSADVKLYEFAVNLFNDRLKKIKNI